jgi:hypothetical protein
VGDDAGDVVGAAGLEAGPDQLDRGVVGGAGREDVGQPPVVQHAGDAVAAQQQVVTGDQLHLEQVGLGLVDAVEGLEDEVAVRVHPGLVRADPALVDEALDEGVVVGQLAELAAAVQIRAAVADVADPEPGAVEQGQGGRCTRAVERRVLVDELPDPVVRPVQGARDLAEQVVGRRRVEAAELLDGGAGGDVAPGRPADTVADREQPGAGVAGVLVVLADAAHVGDGRELEA